jgi:DNA-binding CsgD family transcriptional regulator
VPDTASLPQLTESEREVAFVVAEGLSNEEAAARLGKTIHAVKSLLHRTYEKLGVSNRARLSLLGERKTLSSSQALSRSFLRVTSLPKTTAVPGPQPAPRIRLTPNFRARIADVVPVYGSVNVAVLAGWPHPASFSVAVHATAVAGMPLTVARVQRPRGPDHYRT